MDDVTATPADVLKGKTAYMMGGDDPADGAMPNNGAWAGRIGVNGRVAIPAGYHNGSGYVDQSIPTMGGTTVTPGVSQQTAVAAGRYVTGDVVVQAVAGLMAANIKKGVVIGGVTGTYEGYFVGAADIYNRGSWGSGTAHQIIQGVEGTSALFSASSPGRGLVVNFIKNCYGYKKIVVEGIDFKFGGGIVIAGVHSYFWGADAAGGRAHYDPANATATRLEWNLDGRVINAGAKEHGIDITYPCSISRIYLL